MKILLGDFNTKVGREEILKLIFGNTNLSEIINDNGIRAVNITKKSQSQKYYVRTS
jgi:hypothetical protein